MGNLFYYKKNRGFARLISFLVVSAAICVIFSLNRTENKKVIDGDKNAKNKEDLPVWDLGDLYSGINDENIKNDFLNMEDRAVKFVRKYKGTVKKLSGYELYKAFGELEKIEELGAKIMSFSYLKYASNLMVNENTLFFQQSLEKIGELQSELKFFYVELSRLSDYEIDIRLEDSSNLRKSYGPIVENLKLFRDHILSSDLEYLMTDMDMVANGAWLRLFDETLSKMKFTFENRLMNGSQMADIINNDANEKKRIEAGKIVSKNLERNIKLLSHIANTLARNKNMSDRWRRYDTPISSASLENAVGDETMENFHKIVRENYENIFHRYYKLKAKILGKNKLLYTDKNAPLRSANEIKYSWKKAEAIVIASYREFSPKMAEIGQEFFDGKWIDVSPRQGKIFKTFTQPTTTTAHPYLLLDFYGRANDLRVLAHELGHGIHIYLAKDNGYFMSNVPAVLTETTSIFGERLVFRYLLKNETDLNRKIAIVAREIESMIDNTMGQISSLEFERMVHEERKDGEISPDKLGEIWLSVQRKNLGNIFELGDEYKYSWVYIPHFLSRPFYAYSKAFGQCLANSLYSVYRKDPGNFQDRYLKLLSSGGDKNYTELLEFLAVDTKNRSFWQDGLDVIANLIDELESLLKEAGITL
ncbi:MAG: M3 family metallopeptidase [Rickettsiales bacterium]|nr:M3 family metallopeptidase [Rickettsiales bacterium]